MNPARLTVHRPVLTSMVALIVVILGLTALTRLPVDLLPDITYPVVTVMTSYPNAGAEEVEQLVTRPVEQAAAAITGAQEIRSTSAAGNSNVRVNFAWGTDIRQAVDDLRDRLARIEGQLPDEADRPLVRQFDTQDSPIMRLGVGSQLDAIHLRTLIDNRIAPRLERIPGVAAVDTFGGLEREVRVEVDPDRIQAIDLGLDDLRNRIRDANVITPGGPIMDGRREYRLRTPAEFRSVGEIRDTVVQRSEDGVTYLHQVAEVRDTHQRVTRRFRVNQEEGVQLAVRKLADANTVEVSEAVHAELVRLNRDFPQIDIRAVTDEAGFIRSSITNVGQSILYGSALAVLVLLVFLRNIRYTLVAATAIPLAVISTFGLVYFGGHSLNLMTMGGIALGVGLMVDNAIVVIESIARRREEHAEQSAIEAAVTGTGRVAPAIIASTLTTVAIFLPLFFAQELAGQLFKPLAAVVAFALAASLIVALTVVPMLMARAPMPGRDTSALARMERRYQGLLRGTLAHPWMVIGVSALLMVIALAGLRGVGTEFLPATDEGELRVHVSMEPGTPLDELYSTMASLEEVIRDEVPELQNLVSSSGASAFRASSPASGNMRVMVGSRDSRSRSSEEIAAALREALGTPPGTEIRVRASSNIFFRGFGRGDDEERLSVEVRGFELSTMNAVLERFEEALADVPGITDTRVGTDGGQPEFATRIHRDRAADLGVDVRTIAQTLETALGGSSAGQLRAGGDETRIWVQLRDADQSSLEDLLNLTVRSEDGERVALRSLISFDTEIGPDSIERREQARVRTLFINLGDRSLGEVAASVREALADIPLPEEIDYSVTGDIEEQEAAFSELLLGTMLATLLVYMVMASLYESLRDPLIVMFSIPLAIIGVTGALLVTDTTLNVQSLIGVLLLVGIVVNNAILLVDRMARRHRDDGMELHEAVVAAAGERLRPILMTTLTTILALSPLAIGMGDGGEAQAPMARVVIGGLLSSTLITLVLIPTLYLLFHRRGKHPQPVYRVGAENA
ncbi:efflux RND transporter permease subunit [Thioalkalivibrio sp. HL-Eb18]|uniref:efflux RND transporter permease subunit n=1 Tax=Thioalkalivibrio sp. HL-Eb18 TaxID=1266913 RepID=UPI00037BEE0A|nr:efflux RND transporter permease subunit [Thioalkalivibrio sp. HL-Eb18]